MTITIPPGLNTMHAAAVEALAAGLSIVAVRADGSKAPAGNWREYQDRQPTLAEIDQWFTTGSPLGLGLVTGYGGIEMAETEAAAAHRMTELQDLADASGLADVWARACGWVERSPSGGFHLIYRIDGGDVPGNTKLARDPSGNVLAETRGRGGMVILAPTAGGVHPTGQSWQRIAGGPDTTGVLTGEEAGMLRDLFRTLDQTPAEPALPGKPSVFAADAAFPQTTTGNGEVSPGDDYEARTDWKDILEPEGWRHAHTDGAGVRYWTRPGKRAGISATTGKDPARDRLWVFSSSTALPQEQSLTKFYAYALIHHAGDSSAAAAQLRKDGYGSPRTASKPPPAPKVDKAAPAPEPVDLPPIGDPVELLDAVHAFLGRFIAYPSPEAHAAHTLWILHAHCVEAFETTPRIAFLSPEPGSGKSRCLEMTEALVPRPILSVNSSAAYIFRKISDKAGLPTLLMDEVDALFTNTKTDGSEELRGLLNSGYRQGATVGRAAIRGKEVVTEDWPSFSALALAGLNLLPDTLMTRSIVVHMKRRRPDQVVSPYRRRVNAAEAANLAARLSQHAANIRATAGDAWPDLPEGIEDRDADVWEPILAVADATGGHWPDTAREAAVAMVAAAKERPATLGIRLLSDIRSVLGGRDRIRSIDLVAALVGMETAPWASIKGMPIDARFLARTLAKYDIPTNTTLRFGPLGAAKGYHAADFADAFARYLPTLQPVTDVTDVTDPQRKAGGESDTPPLWGGSTILNKRDVILNKDREGSPTPLPPETGNNGYSGNNSSDPTPHGDKPEACTLHPDTPQPGACYTCDTTTKDTP